MIKRPSQKQISHTYQKNLGYFRKVHYFRLQRFLIAFITLALSVAAILLHYEYGSDQFYNPGPLSRNHASLNNDCEACHRDKRGEIDRKLNSLRVDDLRLESVKQSALMLKEVKLPTVSLSEVKQGASDLQNLRFEHFQSIIQKWEHWDAHSFLEPVANVSMKLTRGINYADLDQACLGCHKGHDLHQPDRETIALKEFRSHITAVHAGSCSSCHREHVGKEALATPSTARCIECHANPGRMAVASTMIRLDGRNVASSGSTGIVRKFADGANHFIPPDAGICPVLPFKSFAEGHPDFEYQRPGLRDPNTLRFNHQLHLGSNSSIPLIDGQKLDCAYCHKPAPDGVYYQRVTYEANCQACHSLQFDPNNPELSIPHGDPEKVRGFLHSLPYQYARLADRKGIRGQKEVTEFFNKQYSELLKRIRSGEDFEKQIFFTADPYKPQGHARPNDGTRALFPGCAMCHDVKTSPSGEPVITQPIATDRWLKHGRFTHARHTQVSCNECHHATESSDTADILLPSKASCAACHRDRDDDVAFRSRFVIRGVRSQPGRKAENRSVPNIPTVADEERAQGGAATDCVRCHTFHAPTTASAEILKDRD